MSTFGIAVGGGPAPGINGVIGAAATRALCLGHRVIGIYDGFSRIMEGDTSHVEAEVTEHRLASKGDRGLVRFANKVVNQRGEAVLEYNPLRLLKRK